jgi:hypothetical protein
MICSVSQPRVFPLQNTEDPDVFKEADIHGAGKSSTDPDEIVRSGSLVSWRDTLAQPPPRSTSFLLRPRCSLGQGINTLGWNRVKSRFVDLVLLRMHLHILRHENKKQKTRVLFSDFGSFINYNTFIRRYDNAAYNSTIFSFIAFKNFILCIICRHSYNSCLLF